MNQPGLKFDETYNLITQCAKCEKFEVKVGKFEECKFEVKENFGVNDRKIIKNPETRVTHGYCKPCAGEIMKEIQKQAKELLS